MANRSTHTEIGSVRNLCWAVASLCLVFGILAYCFWTGDRPIDLEAKKATRRTELRQKVTVEEDLRLVGLVKPEWVNKESAIARIPVSTAVEMAVSELRKKHLGPSSVKIDPLVNLGLDAPKMPSSPSGAATVRFPTITPITAVGSGN